MSLILSYYCYLILITRIKSPKITMWDPISPSKKIKRVELATNSENKVPTSSEKNSISKGMNEVKDIVANVQQEVNVIRGQIKILMEAVSEIKVVVENILKKQCAEVPIHKEFPITTVEKLIQLNDTINEENRNIYIQVVTSILETGGVLKSFKYVIDDKVSLEFNVDGVHGKHSLKKLENIYSVLIEAVSLQNDTTVGSPEHKIRKAMQRQKKRQFKYKCVSKPIADDST